MHHARKQFALIAFLGAVVVSVFVLLIVIWKSALVVPDKSSVVRHATVRSVATAKIIARDTLLSEKTGDFLPKPSNASLSDIAQNRDTKASASFFNGIVEAAQDRVVSAFRRTFSSFSDIEFFQKDVISADKKLFSLAYPESYVEYLRQMQNMMLVSGALDSSESVAFVSEDEIVSFLERFVDYLSSEHLIDPAKVSSFKRGIAVEMRNINSPEAVRRRIGLSRLPAQNIVGELYGMIGPISAYAQVNNADILVLPPSAFPDDTRFVNPLAVPGYQRIGSDQCFRQRSDKAEVGFSVFAPCCDCGKTKKGKFVLHCPDSGRGELLDTPSTKGLENFSLTDFQTAAQMIEPAFRAALRGASPDEFLHFLDNVLPQLPDDVVRDILRQLPREQLAEVTQRIVPFLKPEATEAILDVLQSENPDGYNNVVLGIIARLMPNEQIESVNVADLATITDLPQEIRDKLNGMGNRSLGEFLNNPQNQEIVRGFSDALVNLSFLRGGGPTEVLRFGTSLIRDFGPIIARNLSDEAISELDVADLATIPDLDPDIRSALNSAGSGVSLRDFLSNPDNNAIFQGISGALMLNAAREGGVGGVSGVVAVGQHVAGLVSGFLPNYTISPMDVSDLLTNPDLPSSIRDALAVQSGPLGSVLAANPIGNNILAHFPGATEFLANNPAFTAALASVPSLIGVFDGVDSIGEAVDIASGVARVVARVPAIQSYFASIPNLPGAVMVGTAALNFVLNPGIDTAAQLGVSVAILTGAIAGPVGLAATVAIGLISGGFGGKTCKVKLGCLNKVCGGSGTAEITANDVGDFLGTASPEALSGVFEESFPELDNETVGDAFSQIEDLPDESFGSLETMSAAWGDGTYIPIYPEPQPATPTFTQYYPEPQPATPTITQLPSEPATSQLINSRQQALGAIVRTSLPSLPQSFTIDSLGALRQESPVAFARLADQFIAHSFPNQTITGADVADLLATGAQLDPKIREQLNAQTSSFGQWLTANVPGANNMIALVPGANRVISEIGGVGQVLGELPQMASLLRVVPGFNGVLKTIPGTGTIFARIPGMGNAMANIPGVSDVIKNLPGIAGKIGKTRGGNAIWDEVTGICGCDK